MSTSNTPPLLRSRRSHGWFWITLATLLILPPALLLAGVLSFFHLSSDAGALRNAMLESSEAPWKRQFSFSVGRGPTWVARAALSFVKMDREARAAVAAVRSAEVTLCRLDRAAPLNWPAMLQAGDRTMTARGWERVAGVRQDGRWVAVYVQTSESAASSLRCCVAVCDGRQLVVASARANLESLLACALEHLPAPPARQALSP